MLEPAKEASDNVILSCNNSKEVLWLLLLRDVVVYARNVTDKDPFIIVIRRTITMTTEIIIIQYVVVFQQLFLLRQQWPATVISVDYSSGLYQRYIVGRCSVAMA